MDTIKSLVTLETARALTARGFAVVPTESDGEKRPKARRAETMLLFGKPKVQKSLRSLALANAVSRGGLGGAPCEESDNGGYRKRPLWRGLDALRIDHRLAYEKRRRARRLARSGLSLVSIPLRPEDVGAGIQWRT